MDKPAFREMVQYYALMRPGGRKPKESDLPRRTKVTGGLQAKTISRENELRQEFEVWQQSTYR
jgi:hypothetical protein